MFVKAMAFSRATEVELDDARQVLPFVLPTSWPRTGLAVLRNG
jgi:hypothetical protein